MKKKPSKAKVKKIPTENSKPSAIAPKAVDQALKIGFRLPLHKSKLLISEDELKEEINKII